jgi:hypothetical protein
MARTAPPLSRLDRDLDLCVTARRRGSNGGSDALGMLPSADHLVVPVRTTRAMYRGHQHVEWHSSKVRSVSCELQ